MEKILLFSINDTPIYFDVKKIRECSFEVRPIENSQATFHPETITYVGVTIGGITTGSINKTDAHYTYKSSLTGNGKLFFTDYNGERHEVNSVTVYSSVESAAEKELNGFGKRKTKKGTTYTLFAGPKLSGETYINALRSGDGHSMSYLINEDNKNHALASTCKTIGAFLLQAAHGNFLTPTQKCDAADILMESCDPFDWIMAADILNGLDDNDAIERKAVIDNKLAKVELYRCGNFVFKTMGGQIHHIITQIWTRGLVPAIALAVILLIAACASKNGLGLGIASLSLFFGWFLMFPIIAMTEPPKGNRLKF